MTRPLWILVLCELPAFAYMITGLALDWFPDRKAVAVHTETDLYFWGALILLFGGLIAGLFFARDPRRRRLTEGLMCYACGSPRAVGDDTCQSCRDSFKQQDVYRSARQEFSLEPGPSYGGFVQPRLRLEWRALSKEQARDLPKLIPVLLPLSVFGGVIVYLDPDHMPAERQAWIFPVLGVAGLMILFLFLKVIVGMKQNCPETRFVGRCFRCGTTRSEGVDRCWKCGSEFAPQDARTQPLVENLATRGRIQWPAIERKRVILTAIVLIPILAAFGAMFITIHQSVLDMESAVPQSWVMKLGPIVNSKARAMVFVLALMVVGLVVFVPIFRILGALHRRLESRWLKQFEGRCLFCGHTLPPETNKNSEGRCTSCDAGLARIERWRAQLHASIQKTAQAART